MTTSSEASKRITERFQSLGGWRQKTLERVRAILREVDPEIVEEWKWMGTPVFSHDGIVCTGESYATHVKMTFAKGASLPDPKKLFNASLDGNVRRAIDVREGQALDEPALKQLIRDAIALNVASKTKKKPATPKTSTKKTTAKKTSTQKASTKKTSTKKTSTKKTSTEKTTAKKKACAGSAGGRRETESRHVVLPFVLLPAPRRPRWFRRGLR